MGVNPGWLSTLKVSGTPTAFVAGATTILAADSLGRARRQLTNTLHRILAPTVAVVVKDNGVAVSAANIAHIDYLFGVVTFVVGYTFVGLITVDASYLPVLTVAEGRAFKVNETRTRIDTTTFEHAQATGGGRRTTLGTFGAEGDIELLEGLLEPDLDPGAGTVALRELLRSGTAKLLEVQEQTGWYFRAWVLFFGLEKTSESDQVLKQRFQWVASSQDTTGNSFNANFGVGQ